MGDRTFGGFGAGGGGGGGGATRNGLDFVFRPGVAAGGNVYTTCAALNAAVAAARGARRIFIDTTMGAAVWDATMDFGTEQGPVEVLGTKSVVGVTALTIADGANIRGVDTWTDIAVTCSSTVPVLDGPVADDIRYVFRGRTRVVCTGGAPLVKPTRIAGDVLSIVLEDDAQLASYGGQWVIEVPNSLYIRCEVRDRATLNAHTLKGSNRGNYVSRHGSYATASITQDGGSAWSYQEFNAYGVSYDPTVFGEGISANSVQGAIDYLKLQVWRASDFVAADAAAALGGGIYTVGSRIRLNRAREAVGVRFAWKCAVTTAVTARLRVAGSGTILATASVNVDVAGIYSVDFGSPVDLTSYVGQALSVDVYDGVNYWRVPSSTAHPARPMALDAGVTLIGYYYLAGNGNPTNLAGGEIYGVDLITRGGT